MTVMQGVRVTVAAVGRGYPKTAVTTVTVETIHQYIESQGASFFVDCLLFHTQMIGVRSIQKK